MVKYENFWFDLHVPVIIFEINWMQNNLSVLWNIIYYRLWCIENSKFIVGRNVIFNETSVLNLEKLVDMVDSEAYIEKIIDDDDNFHKSVSVTSIIIISKRNCNQCNLVDIVMLILLCRHNSLLKMIQFQLRRRNNVVIGLNGKRQLIQNIRLLLEMVHGRCVK